jgi:hypothetical protein
MNANPTKVGLFLGTMLGGLHLLWSILVLTGVAQAIYDFVLWAHMIHLNIVIGPFVATAALTLIVVTSVVGYILGYLGALVWNKVHK